MSTDKKRIVELERQVAELKTQNQNMADRMADQEYKFRALEDLVLNVMKAARIYLPC